MTRGALFTDLIQGKLEKIALMPQPDMPAAVQKICVDALSLSPPTRPLILEVAKSSAPLKDALLDRFVGAVKEMKRTVPPVGKRPPLSVDFVVRSHQYDEDRISHMIEDVRNIPQVYDADYEIEHITTSLHAYRLKLWVAKP